MKKIFAIASLLVFVLSACVPGLGQIQVSEAQPTQTPYVVVVTATPAVAATESATPTTAPTNTAIPPTATLPVPTATNSGAACIEDVLATTSFDNREVATVDGVPVQVQVRGSCPQPLFYDPTGVAQGQNYKLHLPKGWSAITVSVTAAVHPDGGKQTDYLECPYLVIQGPFDGSVGLYEGAIRVVTSEWEQGLSDQVLPIHSAQCGRNITPTIISSGQ